MKTTYLLLFAAFTLPMLTGCPSQPIDYPGPQKTPVSAQSTADQIQQLLKQAQTSESPAKEQQLLKATQLLLQEEQRELAEKVLNNLDARKLPLAQYALYAEQMGRLKVQRGLYKEALSSLEDPRLLRNMNNLPTRSQLNLNLLRAEVYALLGSHLSSAQQRINIGSLLNSSEKKANEDGIWNSLMNVSLNDLKRNKNTSNREFRGWLELALIGKYSQGDLDEQVRQLENWQQSWSTHPANLRLPGGLELIKELSNNRPQQVALLLPLTGKLAAYGKSLRDGFIAAMYQTQKRGGKIPRLKFYDTEKAGDFMALYNKSVSDGAEMVIGPLEKQRVQVLFDAGSLPVPTLALNRLEKNSQPASQLFQFGLAPKDEAQQVASIAYLENHRRALVVAPKGEWGRKVTSHFEQRWQELGGQLVSSSIYSGQSTYSSSLKESLLLGASEKRAKLIGRLAGERMEFTPRRRRDVDMVFLLARPAQARSLKPLFAFHYAGNLPVYGTSHLYTGIRSPKRDRDINGIRFTDMPWVLDPPSELHRQIDRELPKSKPYQRMFALGIDSYQLYPRLRQLEEISSSRVYGQTGTLRLNERKEIEREMLLAQVKKGVARIIPAAKDNNL